MYYLQNTLDAEKVFPLDVGRVINIIRIMVTAGHRCLIDICLFNDMHI